MMYSAVVSASRSQQTMLWNWVSSSPLIERLVATRIDEMGQWNAAELIDEVYVPDYVLHDPSLPEPVQGGRRARVHRRGDRRFPGWTGHDR